jgi:hypothetical protein
MPAVAMSFAFVLLIYQTNDGLQVARVKWDFWGPPSGRN